MNTHFAAIAAVALTLGLASQGVAQPVVRSAAALQGVQGRSLPRQQAQPQLPTSRPGNDLLPDADPLNSPVVLGRVGTDAQLVLSPANDSSVLRTNTGAGLTGNNQVQIIYQPPAQ